MFCKCKGLCARGQCKCMREGVACTSLCHKGHTCKNTEANRAAGHGQYMGAARGGTGAGGTSSASPVEAAATDKDTTNHTVKPAALPEDCWEVEFIVAHRRSKKRKRIEFLLRWVDYGSDEDSWEPRSNVEGSLIHTYYKSGNAEERAE